MTVNFTGYPQIYFSDEGITNVLKISLRKIEFTRYVLLNEIYKKKKSAINKMYYQKRLLNSMSALFLNIKDGKLQD